MELELKEEVTVKLPVIATIDYLKIFSDEYGYLCSNNFLLPFYIEKRMIFKRIVFTIGTVKISDGVEDEVDFLNEVVIYVKNNLRVDFISIPNNTAIFSSYPLNSLFCEFGSYIVDLRSSEDELFKKLHTKHRNVIRKAKNDGVQVYFGVKYFETCKNIILETLRKEKMICPSNEYFTKLRDNLEHHVEFVVAVFNGEACGSAILVWNAEHSAYYLFGGSVAGHHNGAMNLLHWEMMLKMKERGVNFYNFVGARIDPEKNSKLEGIQRFKSRFGSELSTGYLWKYPINKTKYKLYYLLAHLFSFFLNKKYRGDIIDQEIKGRIYE